MITNQTNNKIKTEIQNNKTEKESDKNKASDQNDGYPSWRTITLGVIAGIGAIAAVYSLGGSAWMTRRENSPDDPREIDQEAYLRKYKVRCDQETIHMEPCDLQARQLRTRQQQFMSDCQKSNSLRTCWKRFITKEDERQDTVKGCLEEQHGSWYCDVYNSSFDKLDKLLEDCVSTENSASCWSDFLKEKRLVKQVASQCLKEERTGGCDFFINKLFDRRHAWMNDCSAGKSNTACLTEFLEKEEDLESYRAWWAKSGLPRWEQSAVKDQSEYRTLFMQRCGTTQEQQRCREMYLQQEADQRAFWETCIDSKTPERCRKHHYSGYLSARMQSIKECAQPKEAQECYNSFQKGIWDQRWHYADKPCTEEEVAQWEDGFNNFERSVWIQYSGRGLLAKGLPVSPKKLWRELKPEFFLSHARYILSVSDTALRGEVQRAYRKLSAIYHPDKRKRIREATNIPEAQGLTDSEVQTLIGTARDSLLTPTSTLGYVRLNFFGHSFETAILKRVQPEESEV